MPPNVINVLLKCPDGHEIKKYKRLKPWQGWTKQMRCGLCTVDIHRDELRWRCECHCEYNVCTECFDSFYMDLIIQASVSDTQKRHDTLLEFIPTHLKQTDEYERAQNWTAPQPSDASSSRETGKSKKKGKNSKQSALPEAVPEQSSECMPRKLQVLIWMIILLVSLFGSALAQGTMLFEKDVAFPSPFLMVGLMYLLTFALLELTAMICYRCHCLGTPVDMKQAGCFGLIMGLQQSTNVKGVTASPMIHDLFRMFYPITVSFAAFWGGTEQPTRLLIFSVFLVAIGGLLGVGAESTFSFTQITGTDVLPMELPTIFLGTVRLLLTQRFLQTEDETGRRPLVSPLILAGHMCFATAVTNFEICAFFDHEAYGNIFQSPDPSKTMGLLLTIAVLNAWALLAELQLLQLTCSVSVAFLLAINGLCCSVASQLPKYQNASALFGEIPMLTKVGALLTALASALFVVYNIWNKPHPDPYGYQRLEDEEKRGRNGHKDKRRKGPQSSIDV